jgi:hypothetical protein
MESRNISVTTAFAPIVTGFNGYVSKNTSLGPTKIIAILVSDGSSCIT